MCCAVSSWPSTVVGLPGEDLLGSLISIAQIPLGSTRHVRRAEPMHFGCVELVEQHSSTRSTGSTRRTRLARLARHVELDWLDTTSSRGATCNLVMVIVIHLLFNLSYSLIYWSIHLFNLFHLAKQIRFVCVRKNKNTRK